MVLLDPHRRRELLALLASLALLEKADGRDLLLQGLPEPLCDTIERSGATLVDLEHIVDTCDRWPATGNPPLLILLENAAALVEGTPAATQLRAWQSAWPSAPVVAPPPNAALSPSAGLPIGTVTFLFTDIEQSTDRWERYPEAMKTALARHDLLVRQAIEGAGGIVFQTAGDSFAAVFVLAGAALQAAVTAQRHLQTEPWAAPIGPLHVRMALHTGAAELRDEGWHAEFTLNRLARLLAAGSGGQILLSEVTRELLRESLPAGITLRDLGQHRLKDLLSPLHIYQILAPDLPADFPPLKSLGTVSSEEVIPAETGLTLENPYKGLRAFQQADAPDFFGREALTARLVARLGEAAPLARFLVVVGPSGSGKSSVVRAGLLTALRQGSLPGSQHWTVAEVVPGSHPLEEIEAVLLRVAVNPPASLLPQLQEDERGLIRAVKRVLPAEDDHELLLVLDQFEEVFTLITEEPARVHFLASLCAAVQDPRSRVRVVATLRADFYDRPLLYPDPGELVRQRTEVVLPLTPEELYRAITGPARRVGVQLEEELITTIMQDVGEQPGTLPLLQYALTELFDQRQGRRMTLAAYRTSGGVLGALSRRAEEIYCGLSAAEQALARQVFLRLVTLGEGTEDTRRRVRSSELISLVDAPAGDLPPPAPATGRGARPPQILEAVLEAFGRWRLVTFDWDAAAREPTVEVAHEALLRTWPRLRQWLDASREELRVQRRLDAEAADWVRAGRDPSFLATGTRLAQFAALATATDLVLTGEERAYVAASMAERDRQTASEQARQMRELILQRRAATQLRALVGVLALFLIVALLLTGLTYNQSQVAERQARVNRAQALVAQSIGQDRNPELGILLAMEAISTTRRMAEPALPEAIMALHLAIARSHTRLTLRGHTRAVNYAAYSPEGAWIVTASGDRTAKVWNAHTGELKLTLAGHTDAVWSANYSPDGRYIVTASDDQSAIIWDAVTGRLLLKIGGNVVDDAGNYAVFSADGRSILTASGKRAGVWDAKSGRRQLELAGHTDWLSSAAYSPDGKSIATAGGGDHLVIIWDATTGNQRMILRGHSSGVISVVYSPDGAHLLTASNDGTARIWDAVTGQELIVLKGHANDVLRANYSPDGTTIVTASADKTVMLWDAVTGQPRLTLRGHDDVVFSAVFSPDGRSVLTASLDKTAKVWDPKLSQERPILIGHQDGITAIAYSPDNQRIATASKDRTAKVWDARTGQQILTLQGHTASVNGIVYSPDGQRLATASSDKTARIWDANTGKELLTLQGHTDLVNGIAWSPDGRSLATASSDWTAKVWDLATGQERLTLKGHTDRVWSAAWSPDGLSLVTAGNDHLAKIWEAGTGHLLRTLQGHTDRVMTAGYSPDGRWIVTAGNDTTAIIWNATTGREQIILHGHSGLVNSASFNRDGTQVATASDDATVKIWDHVTGVLQANLSGHDAGVVAVAYSPDGQYVATASDDRTARQYLVQLPDLLALAQQRVTRALTPEERATYLGEPLPTPPPLPPDSPTPTTAP